MNSINKTLNFFIFLLIFISTSFFQSHLLFASTSTVGTQNTFGALTSGESTENQKYINLKNAQKQITSHQNIQLQNSKETPSHSLSKEKQLAIHSYKNLILAMIEKNIIDLSILQDMIQNKDIFIENQNLNLEEPNSHIYLNALKKLKPYLIKSFNNEEWQSLFLEFLNFEWNKKSDLNQIKQEAESETKDIFYPHIISTQDLSPYFYDPRSIQYDFYNNPDGDLIAVLTSNSSSRFIYLFNVTKNQFIRAIDMNPIAGNSLSTLQLLPALILKFDHKSHALVKTKDGKDIIVIETSASRIFFIDLATGLEVHKSIFMNNSNTYSKLHPEIYTLQNGIQAVLFESSNSLQFIDINTGKPVVKNNTITFFGKTLNYSRKLKPIKKPYELSTHKIDATLSNGEKIIILAYDHTLLFIDPYHTKEKHNLYELPKDAEIKSFFITKINSIKYLYINTTTETEHSVKNQNYFIDIKTGLPLENSDSILSNDKVLLNSENFQSEINFYITVDFNPYNSKIHFINILSGAQVHEPIDVHLKTVFLPRELMHLSFLFKNNSGEIILAFFNDKNTQFINLQSGEFLFSIDHESIYNETLNHLDKNLIKTYKNDTLLITEYAENLQFNSTSNGTEVFTSITSNEFINHSITFNDPRTGQEFVFFMTNTLKLNPVSLNSISKKPPPNQGDSHE